MVPADDNDASLAVCDSIESDEAEKNTVNSCLAHDHNHEHHHHDSHDLSNSHHTHDHHQHKNEKKSDHAANDLILTIRSHSGLSGDMILAGLMRMCEISEAEIADLVQGLLPNLDIQLKLTRRSINNISGWHAQINLPPQHTHRHLTDIIKIIQASPLSLTAKKLAEEAFTLLAHAEGSVHNLPITEVHFHEVGALDSILDTCLSCELYSRIAPARLVVSPLPLADGSVKCAHGILPVPAPAVLQLLPGLSVKAFAGSGETLTPTAAALLNVLPVDFGPWPEMRIKKTALVFGDYIFDGVPNGATFALGVKL